MNQPPEMLVKPVDETLKTLRQFFKMESAGGITLMIAMVLALIVANSPLHEVYHSIFEETYMTVTLAGFGVDKPLHYWINDGLMAVFFLLVGLEIKREVLEGELSSKEQAMLPAIAAFGGILCPALFYVYFNQGDANALNGWAIPAATDIAFALGILALFGKRVPITLKIFLTAVAVIDDLAAIVIIALFYTANLSINALLAGALCALVLLILNVAKVNRLSLYILVGVIMWVAVLKSGVHATLAGVALGLLIPHRVQPNGHSMLTDLEHALHPWVAFMVLPIFAFANAGISFSDMSLKALTDPIPIGIAVGLFVGKQIGIFGFSFLAIKSGLVRMPREINWKQFYAVCVLCGVGFTMSLFIGGLAFDDTFLQMEARVGILMGSGLSAILGAILLALSLPSVEERERRKAEAAAAKS